MNALEIKGLTKHFSGFSLDHLDLTLPSGCILGLIGENGAGKSTTIKLILDILHKDGGTVTVLGRDNEKEIRAIFARIIEKRIALEVNTSGIGDRFGELMPSVPLLALYREMGGELLTIGSDAHVPHRVGNALEDTKAVLRKLGFSTYCYYKNRKTQFVVS